MKHSAFPLAAALLLVSCQGDPPRHDMTETEAQTGNPALWEISDGKGNVEGWLFGTIHTLPDGVKWQSSAFYDIAKQADMLVVEVANLEDGNSLQALFSQMAFDTPSGPVSRRIDPQLSDDFNSLIEKGGVNPDAFDGMESWAAALALAQLAQAGKSENGVDMALLKQFSGRDIVELEGASAQLQVFDSLPEKEQRDLLNAVIQEAAENGNASDKLASVWKSGDLKQLEAITRKGMLADPELKQALLVDRNADWATKLANLLSTDTRPLVAVGAGHMLGDQGLPALLTQQGYIVRRVQ